MKELREYRASLINRLVEVVHEFRAECLAVQDAFAPFKPGGWNTHQVAAHTRDVDKLAYGSRARRTADEENPEFLSFDGEAYMAEHYSASEPLEVILDGLVGNVESLAEMLRELPAEAWSRVSRHAMLGRELALQTWVEKGLAHIEEHLRSIKEYRAGKEKQNP
jgi:hypothetical protein